MADLKFTDATATAEETTSFAAIDVVRIEVHLGSSGGIDNLSWCTPSAGLQGRKKLGQGSLRDSRPRRDRGSLR